MKRKYRRKPNRRRSLTQATIEETENTVPEKLELIRCILLRIEKLGDGQTDLSLDFDGYPEGEGERQAYWLVTEGYIKTNETGLVFNRVPKPILTLSGRNYLNTIREQDSHEPDEK